MDCVSSFLNCFIAEKKIYGKCARNYLEQKIQSKNCLRYKFIVTIDFMFGLILD